MQPQELSTKTEQELRQLAGELQATLRDARFKVATRQLKNTSVMMVAKRDFARVQHALSKLSRSQA